MSDADGRAKVAVLDDTQHVAKGAADWSALDARADVVFLHEPFADEDDAATRLAPFDVLLLMRERTAFPPSLLARLPRLRMIALTGGRAPTLDVPACTARGVPVCTTGANTAAATTELALALLLACARAVPVADRTVKAGGWHDGVPVGTTLEGTRLGLLGLGRLGTRMAGYGRALGMEVVAWSPNLTAERAEAGGARLVSKAELFATADAVSVHLVLSDRTRGIVGAAEIGAMKPGAILVNTSRGPLVDEAALVAALERGAIRAGLDVYDREPLPPDHPLRRAPNAVLTPHLGYGSDAVFRTFYRDSVENILAFLDGRPIRVLNPDALGG